MDALLFRKWGNNVKGRDWFDMEWYIKKGTPLNLKHFVLRAKDSGDWPNENITQEELLDLLNTKIDNVDFNRIKADISRFIPNPKILDLWSPKYFHDLVGHLKFL